jgi:hypothetical protein
MNVPSEDARHRLARRFPRSTRIIVLIGGGTRAFLLACGILLGIGLGFYVLGAAAREMLKQGWTGQLLVAAALGLVVSALGWVLSWPAYVWLGLFALFLLLRIESRLAHIAGQLSGLDRRAVKLGRAINALRGSDRYDPSDE